MSRALLLLSALALLPSRALPQSADTYGAEVPNAYVQLLRPITVSTPLMAAPISARAYGYIGLALYEAVVHGIPERNSLVGVLPHLPNLPEPQPAELYHWPTVANHAMCLVIDSMFFNMNPADRTALYALRDAFDQQYGAGIPYAMLVRSAAMGQGIGHGVLDMARTDGGHRAQLYTFSTTYEPPVGPEHWQPFLGQNAMLPEWGWKRPFLQANVEDGVLPPGPPPFSTVPGSLCYEAAMEVYDITTNITVPQQTIAYYWNDGDITPPYHSMRMLEMILHEQQQDLAFAAVAYAKMGLSLADSFVSCWLSKYVYNWVRPVTYIGANIDPDWTTWIVTPPFPEYTSGHSSQGGAWLRVMEELFGMEYAFTDSTHGPLHGGPRSFSSFAVAAEEIAMSRIYGGIHYRYGNDDGKQQGRAVAENVIELFDAVMSMPDVAGPVAPEVRYDAALDRYHVVGASPQARFVVYDAVGRTVDHWQGPGPHALASHVQGVLLLRSTNGGTAARLPMR